MNWPSDSADGCSSSWNPFDTPVKENDSSWIPGKSPSKRRKLFAKSPSLSPIKSPRKPLQTHNKIIANVKTLLLPTPTKTERVLPTFEDESANIQSGRKSISSRQN
ncbi:hypothetical protein WR25_05512 [Diploscapter pachys]|uniref:Uncharacterized protein n=1 Tax=Diploscapter pachys TaxID=2018661 RepID=A0A2A2KPK5_9BILA|nr:hypothetical protein WR25_05512 [Diploscapter pachys]